MIQEIVIPLVTLVILEIVLGIDNIIFISILSDKLPVDKRDKLRVWGIGLALAFRLVLLALISWIMKLNTPLFEIMNLQISGKDLILIIGGLFLLFKSTKEIYHKTESVKIDDVNNKKSVTFQKILVQVILLDLVFSIDSIITAVGMVSQLWIMYTAVIISVVIMLLASKAISKFINDHPSFKILALCFLLIIGISLIAEGLHNPIAKGYIYFAMTFSFIVDLLQMKLSKK